MLQEYWKKYVSKKVDRFKNSDEFKTLCQVLNEFYGEDRWDYFLEIPETIKFDKGYRFGSNRWQTQEDHLNDYMTNQTTLQSHIDGIKIVVTILFPEIKLTNRDNLQHVIKDLYLQIIFPIFNPNFLVKLKGTRATVNKNEFVQHYKHSHLPSGRDYETFNNFCLGNSEMSGCLQSEFITTEKSRIYQFLFTLQNYLEYESIEGVPYIRMEKCQNLSDLDKITFKNVNFEKIVKSKPPIKLNKDLKILNKEEIEEFYSDKIQYLSTKIENRYYSILPKERVESLETQQNRVLFLFKNQEIKLKIKNYANVIEPKKFPHPAITKRLIEYWENRVLQTYIRNYRIERENTISNTSEHHQPSEISQ